MVASSTLPDQPATDPDEGAADRIVFFDGVCGLCNHTVNFLLNHDKGGKLRFAPLQGETARKLLREDQRDLSTLVYRDGGRDWTRSSAVVRILWQLGGAWSLLGSLLWLIPLPLRNLGYRLVAALRYTLFGKRETCRLPTPEERARFLP